MNQFNRKEIKEEAREKIRGKSANIGLLFLIAPFVSMITLIPSVILELGGLSNASGYVDDISSIITSIITIIVTFIAIRFCLSLSRSEDITVSEASSIAMKKFFKLFKVSILISLVTIGWALLSFMPVIIFIISPNILTGLFMGVAILVSISLGTIWTLKYRFAFPIVMDIEDVGVRESLKISSDLTRGLIWELFVFDLSFLWWILLDVISFGIASIYVMPYKITAECILYDKLSEFDKEEDAEPLN